MIATILQLVALLLLPAAAMALERRSRWLCIIPTVLVCYGAGIVLGNLPGVRIDTALSLAVCSGAVALAIPLLLFSVDIVAWFRTAPAFIGPVVVSLKNRELVVSGISTNLVGLAIGNYAGLFVAWLLSREGIPW